MTDVQKAALARGEEQTRHAMELYAERNKLAAVYYRLSLDDLRRLNALVRQLDDGQLRMVAAYAEGLAAWGEAAPESADAPLDPPDTRTPGAGA